MTVRRDRIRLAVLGAAAAMLAVATTAFPAGAQSATANLDQARQEAGRVKSAFERLAQAYGDQNTKLNLTEERMIHTRAEITRGLAQKAALEAQLRKRARAAYGMGGLGLFQIMLDGRSFHDFSVRYMTLQRQSSSDEGIIVQLRRKRTELEAKQRQLSEERSTEAAQAAGLRDEGRQLTISFAEGQQLVANLEGKLKAEQIAQLFRMGAAGDVHGLKIPLAACPVSGLHFVNNDFGAPRDGGARRHQGNDIMASMGTPIVAPIAGTITLLQSGGRGGLAIFETGVGNVEFYFAHEQEITARQGQEVAAGQEIGRVGNTGNSAGGAPHLHFEIHPAWGAAIDPYPSLSAVC
jgi:murein DD-endopeptidase MepM/ murein hydrolase activator NlpD